MISGANEEELNVANDRADLLLEIEKQKGTIQYLSECINEKDGLIIAYRKEVDRLNNIINELEKWAKSIQLTVYRNDNMPVYQHQDVLDKIKELKENK